MKRFTLLLLSFTLVLSLAAPAGAVFADGEVVEGQVLGAEHQEVSSGSRALTSSDDAIVTKVPTEVTVVGAEQEAVMEPEEANDIPEPDSEPETKPSAVPVVPVRLSDKRLVLSYVQTSSVYGKYIEIRNVSDEAYETKELTLQFIRTADTNGNNPDVLARFYGTIPAHGRIIVAQESLPGNQSADVFFSQTAAAVMSPSGGWLLLVDGVSELDSFCWATNGLCGDDFYTPLPLREEKAYSRCFVEEKPAECSSDAWYEPVPMRHAVRANHFVPFYNACSNIEVSEVAPQLLDQFIELYNPTEDYRSLEGCVLQIQTRTYQFGADWGVEAGAHLVVSPVAIGVSLPRTTAGEVRILSSNGEVVSSLRYTSPKENRSAVRDVDGVVVWTLAPTPGAQNQYVQYAPCEEGYWRNEETGRCNKTIEAVVTVDCGEGRERNPATGRCRNIPTARELTPCKEGQYRSEETNRCRSIATAAASVLKPCADDQFRNPATNRCKKIASAEELADCGEGRERNPETNRCRNVLSTAMPTAAFAPEAITQTAQSMLGWWVLGGVTLVALGYAGWQWRFEVSRALRRIGQVFSAGPKP